MYVSNSKSPPCRTKRDKDGAPDANVGRQFFYFQLKNKIKSGEQECSPYTGVHFTSVYLFSAAGQLTTSDKGTVVVSCWGMGTRKR